MSVPDRPGYYWWRWTKTDLEHDRNCRTLWWIALPDRWQIVYVRDTRQVSFLGSQREFSIELLTVAGEWGPRIPSSKRLAAMEEMAREEPNACLSSDYDEYGCFFCNAEGPMHGEINHKPDCPWLLAQEADDAMP